MLYGGYENAAISLCANRLKRLGLCDCVLYQVMVFFVCYFKGVYNLASSSEMILFEFTIWVRHRFFILKVLGRFIALGCEDCYKFYQSRNLLLSDGHSPIIS